MNIKIFAVAAAAGLLLSTTIPAALADSTWNIGNLSALSTNIRTRANTGHNSINSVADTTNGSIASGVATVGASLSNFANWTELALGSLGSGDSDLTVADTAAVEDQIRARANTGRNSINAGEDVDGGSITTSDADAQVVVATDVNTTIIGVGSTAP